MFRKNQLTTIEEYSKEYGFTELDIDRVIEYLKAPGVYNPLDNRTQVELENKGLRETFLMYDPNYLYYTAKMLLNIELPPIQCCVLREFWTHAFPMFVGSRGVGKCLKEAYIYTYNGIKRIENMIQDVPGKQDLGHQKTYGENKNSIVDYGWCNGFSETKAIKTRMGFELEGTFNHPIRAVRNGKIEWVELQDIKVGDKVPLQREYPEFEKDNGLDLDIAYMLGALVGDGCWSRKISSIGFTNIDQDCIDAVNVGLLKYCGYTLRKCANIQKYQYYVGNKQTKNNFIKDFAFNEYDGGDDKVTPNCIWGAPRKSICAYLRGLMDTDGCVTCSHVEFCSKSKKLAQDTQFLLLTLGIVSRLRSKYNKKYSKYYYNLVISGSSLRIFKNKVGFQISRKQKTLEKICNKKSNDNYDLLPHDLVLDNLLKLRELARDTKMSNGHGYNYDRQSISLYKLKNYELSYISFSKILDLLSVSPQVKQSNEYRKLIENSNYYYDEIVEIKNSYAKTYDIHLKDDHSFISNGFISHNSFLIAVYSLLRAILFPGTKIVITGSAFRQGKYVYDYIERIWKDSHIAQSLIKGHQPSARLPDMWKFSIGNSEIIITPVGCLTEDTFITTDTGIRYIKELENYSGQVWSKDKFCDIGFFHNNGIKQTHKINTNLNIEIKGTLDHKIKIVENNKIVWKELQDIAAGDTILIDITQRWFNNSKDNYSADIAYNLGQFINKTDRLSNELLSCSKDIMTNFIKGILSVSQMIDSEIIIEANNTVCKQLQYILFHYGIVSRVENDKLIILDNENLLSKIDEQNIDLIVPNYYYDTVKTSERYFDLMTYDINVPENNTYIANGIISHNTGEKIRGLRANIIISDEFNSINPEIYEVVISQFAAVSTSPIENVKLEAQKKILQERGISLKEDLTKLSYFNNQSIICGTMKFDFEPMAMYWKKYKEIIESKGQNLTEMFGDLGGDLNWKDFTLIRVPFEVIPRGYMDPNIVARSKATMHSEYYKAEYNCVPISDTDGFFKRSLIETCTAKTTNINKENWAGWCHKTFEGKIRGDKNLQYVFGIDPASEQDNFSIVIVELHPEHQRVVYCWTTNRQSFKKQNLDDKNYYAFCARKIRNLMKAFPCLAIGIDSQGGGFAVEEALHDADKLEPGETAIWPIIEDKEKDTDNMPGLHILHMINFSSAEWTANSNHTMKKDMEDKILLFPQFNSVLLGLASEKDKSELTISDNFYDTLEDCMLELEALKDELSIISRTRTPAGRERWDTPEIKTGRNRKSKLRKDRYSALLIANAVARSVYRAFPEPQYNVVGAAVGSTQKNLVNGQMYIGAEWYNVNSNLFRGITR